MKQMIILAAAVVLGLTGCREEDERDFDTVTSQDLAIAQEKWDDIYNISEEGTNYTEHDPDGKRAIRTWYINSCATITVDSAWPDTTYPKTIVIDFGTGCVGNDGRTRSGKLTIVTTGRYRESGTQITTSPTNYYVDGYKVEGTKTVVNQGFTGDNLIYTVDVNNAKITKPDGGQVLYSSIRQREWAEGIETNLVQDGIAGLRDDVYWITGSIDGVNSAGRAFTSRITEKLVVELDCRHITSGSLTTTPADLEPRTINWGTGTCDNVATVTIAGRTFTITLR